MQYHFYTAKELGELAGCAKITVQKWIEKGKLPSFRQGKYGQKRQGRHIILAEDAERFIVAYRSQATRVSAMNDLHDLIKSLLEARNTLNDLVNEWERDYPGTKLSELPEDLRTKIAAGVEMAESLAPIIDR